jgi:hypothetical protein
MRVYRKNREFKKKGTERVEIIMGGMPSARGLEWRTDGQSRMRFTEGFEKIPRNPDGSMRVNPLNVPTVEQRVNLPESCSVCMLKDDCDTSCSHGSPQCMARIGVDGKPKMSGKEYAEKISRISDVMRGK